MNGVSKLINNKVKVFEMAMNMKFAVVAALAFQSANAYSSLLADCESFAGLFSATCGGTYQEDYAFTDSNWVTTALSSDITCDTPVTNQFMHCIDGSSESE